MNTGKLFTFSACLAAVAAAFLLVADAEGVSAALTKAADSCLTVIIPSLFGFMALSSILISGGIYRFLFKPLHFVFGRLLGMELYPFSVFLMSLLGGYPVGARLISDMADEEKNLPLCENMLCYCYCPSPSFTVTVMGLCIFGSTRAGLLIYLSNVISCAIAAVFINKIRGNEFFSSKNNIMGNKSCIVSSVMSSGASMLKICAFILFFAVITELLRYSGLFAALFMLCGELGSSSVRAFIEIGNITALSAAASNPLSLPVAAAISSFGGVCILFQTAALTDGKIKLGKFLLARIPLAVFSGVTAHVGAALFPAAVTAGAKTVEYVQISSVKPLASAFLIVMCAILLKNCKKNSKKGSIF